MCRYARNIKPRSAKRLVAVMPRRGLSAVDGVEGLPRGGKQRAQIFTLCTVDSGVVNPLDPSPSRISKPRPNVSPSVVAVSSPAMQSRSKSEALPEFLFAERGQVSCVPICAEQIGARNG